MATRLGSLGDVRPPSKPGLLFFSPPPASPGTPSDPTLLQYQNNLDLFALSNINVTNLNLQRNPLELASADGELPQTFIDTLTDNLTDLETGTTIVLSSLDGGVF